jgi:hypothetical protein
LITLPVAEEDTEEDDADGDEQQARGMFSATHHIHKFCNLEL